MKFLLRLLAVTVLLAAGAGAAPAGGSSGSPVLVELFTSQGCSSCPPADALAGRLTRRDDLVVLSFHVNYWDYIGWQDPFATEATTGRQHHYAETLHERTVYTPQMVIAGTTPVVGSDEAAVTRAIEKASRRSPGGPQITVARVGDGFRVSLGAGRYPGSPADVLLVLYDRRHETPVSRGENRGRTVVNHNVVRLIEPIGKWDGSESRIDLSHDDVVRDYGRNGCVIIVQAAGQGPVIAAANFDMARGR
jgi:hypothetical protein